MRIGVSTKRGTRWTKIEAVFRHLAHMMKETRSRGNQNRESCLLLAFRLQIDYASVVWALLEKAGMRTFS
jgi:hypothetical protein